ncbi:MAG: hypothetical protein H6670_00945 [Anaerolineaceae bacterium]|nr:hypothetical protein [Anaerolineaceae bacterium]
MAEYDIKWFVDNRVIMAHFPAGLDADNLTEQFDILINMINEADDKYPLVHILMNGEDIRQYPKQVAKIGNIMKSLLENARLGWIVLYGRDDRMIKFLSTAIAGMFKTRFRFFYNQEEAFAFLNSVDENLPDLSKYQTTR